MAKFNYRLFREYLQNLLKDDFELIRMFDSPSYTCLIYPLDYCDVFDKIEACVRALVEFGVIELLDESTDFLSQVRILHFVRANGF